MPLFKGQLISKAIYGLLTSPKKRTDEFVLFAFLLFMANKSNLSVRFLGEPTARQSAFCFYLTFSGDRASGGPSLFSKLRFMIDNCCLCRNKCDIEYNLYVLSFCEIYVF